MDAATFVIAADTWSVLRFDARDKAAIIYALGIKQVIVVISNMDNIKNQPGGKEAVVAHYNQLEEEVGAMFKSLGFSLITTVKDSKPMFDGRGKRAQFVILPASGRTDSNLLQVDKDVPYWANTPATSTYMLPTTRPLSPTMTLISIILSSFSFFFNPSYFFRLHVFRLHEGVNIKLHQGASREAIPHDDIQQVEDRRDWHLCDGHGGCRARCSLHDHRYDPKTQASLHLASDRTY